MAKFVEKDPYKPTPGPTPGMWEEDPYVNPIYSAEPIGGPPEAQEQRWYDYLTGEQFFTDPYSGVGSEYIDPFYEGGQYEIGDLATMYAGVPVVSGYYTTEEKTPESFVAEKSLYGTASQLRELRETDIPMFEEWLATNYPDAAFQPDLTQTEEYQGVADLVGQLLAPGATEEDLLAAESQAALQQGFANVEEYRASKVEQRTQLEQGVMGQQGVYGTTFEDVSRRAHGVEVQNLIAANLQMVEALGTKSSAAAYTKMAEVSNQIANTNAQYELKLAEQDLLMRQIEYEAMSNRLAQMQAQGLAVQEQYLTQLTNNRMGALQAYAQNLTAIIATNEAYFQMYGQDLEAIQIHANTVYQSIMAEIGVDQAAMERANEAYEQYMAPYLDELNAWYMKEQLRLAGAGVGGEGLASFGAGLTGALGGAGTGALIGSVIPGLSTAVGAVIGGLIGFFGGLFG